MDAVGGELRLCFPERGHRSGPGHKVHISRDGRTTFCKVENNARGLDFGLVLTRVQRGDYGPLRTLEDVKRVIRGEFWSPSKLCGNCRTLLEREERDG